MNDEYKDFFEMIRKIFKERFDIQDKDIFIFPEKDFKINPNDPRFKDIKKYKISYHFEPGMDKPEIKFDGDFDDEMINNYLKNFDLRKLPNLGKPIEKRHTPDRGVDAGSLTLEPCSPESEECLLEPYTEINDFDEFTEILIEVPGIEEDDIELSFSNGGKILTFTAERAKRSYHKEIRLPFSSSQDNIHLDVNNGIATLKVKRDYLT